MTEEFASYSLLDALRFRRSRRFSLGMELDGPLQFKSRFQPTPISFADEAALAFAACGMTGAVAADFSYTAKGGGSIMAGFVGRTIASGDGIQSVALAVTNDAGTWFYRRPQDFPPTKAKEIAEATRVGNLELAAERSRVRILDHRARIPSTPLLNIDANRFSAHAPGTSYFLPINELTLMYINGLLEILNEQTGAYILDERANFQSAGLKPFARSRGGHLNDDPGEGRVVTVALVERMVSEFVTVEQGMMLQNLGLMTEALGLGGFPNFANHDFAWFDALGFKMQPMPMTQYLGMRGLPRLAVKLLGKEMEVPCPVGLEVGGEPLLRAYSPPHFPSMRHAVEAVVEYKFGKAGAYARADAWKNSEVRAAVPRVSERAVAATIAHCEYLWHRYGRFPVHMPPFRTVLGFQVGHPDLEFYEQHYPAGSVRESHRRKFEKATAGQPGIRT